MKNIVFFGYIILILSCCGANNIKQPLGQKRERYDYYENFSSKNVEKRDIEVWLPEGYDKAQSLPVLYMFDGQNIFHGFRGWDKDKYNHGWQVDETLDSLYSSGRIPKVIVVGIHSIGKRRYSEYTPAKPKSLIKKRMSNAKTRYREVYMKYGIANV